MAGPNPNAPKPGGFFSDLGYRFWELPTSPEINLEPDGIKVVRHLLCAGTDAIHICRELVGFPYRRVNDLAQVRLLPSVFLVPPIDPAAIAAVGGQAFAEQYSLAPIICTKASSVPVSGTIAAENQALEQNTYQIVQVNASYETVGYNIGNNPGEPNKSTDLDANGMPYFTTVQEKFGGKTTVTPQQTYCWYDEFNHTYEYASGNDPQARTRIKALIPEGVPWTLPTIEVTAKRHACLAKPAAFYTPYLNKVNATPLLGYAVETLLFLGGDTAQGASVAGIVVNELGLNFLHRPEGHNRLPRWPTGPTPLPTTAVPPNDGTSFRYQRVCRVTDATQPLYELAELKHLWG